MVILLSKAFCSISPQLLIVLHYYIDTIILIFEIFVYMHKNTEVLEVSLCNSLFSSDVVDSFDIKQGEKMIYFQCTLYHNFNGIFRNCLDSFSRGWHYNMFCTSIFVLSQDESQGSITEIADGQKSYLLLSEQRSTSYFSKTTISIICSTYVEYGCYKFINR